MSYFSNDLNKYALHLFTDYEKTEIVAFNK